MLGTPQTFEGVEGLPDRTYPDPNDTRLHYEIVRQLAQSVREQTTALLRMQEQLATISERLVKIESNRLHDDVERLRSDLYAETARVDALMRDKDRRDGAISAWEWIQRSAPWAAILAAGAGLVAWLKN